MALISAPNNNYGNYENLEIRRDSNGDYMISYIEFNLTSIPKNYKVKSAVLELYTLSPGSPADATVSVYNVN